METSTENKTNEEVKNEVTRETVSEKLKNKKIIEKIMSILAYLGILIIIPLLVSKNKPNVKFHIKQGLVLLSMSVIVWILGYLPIWALLRLVDLGILILSIIGIINVINNKQEELPLVGKMAKYFKF